MDTIERLRHIARRCFELARLQQGWAAENLNSLGREYEARADQVEARHRPGPPPPGDRPSPHA
jgi:hypothetical protein